MNSRIFFILLPALIGIDALSKIVTPYFLQVPIPLIGNLLSLEYVQNSGIAFSFPLTGWGLKIITCILIFAIYWYYTKQEKPKKNKILDIGYLLVFAGAFGNAWERIFQGYVTDMISLEGFAVFNIADSYITLGAFCIAWYYWKYN